MRPRSDIRAILIALAVLTSSASANDVGSADFVPPTHPMSKASKVDVVEKLGAKLPVDAQFRDHTGKLVTLGDVLAGELPTILTFNYSDCPMLCSLQLNGLTAALPATSEPFEHGGKKVQLELGQEFRIVTIDLEPYESLEKMSRMRAKYMEKAKAKDGWTFLVAATPGDAAAIRRVAEAVGFAYTYVPERAEWAHPAALIFVSTSGTVTRYVYGIEFAADAMRDSILKAGIAEASTAVGFMNRCYHFDPDASSSARSGVLALRLGAAGFALLFVTGLGVFHVVRRRRTPGES